MSFVAGVADQRDTTISALFTIGSASAGHQWMVYERLYARSMVIMEITATIVGDAADVAAVLNGDLVVSMRDAGTRKIFERPLALLLVRGTENRDVELEARVARLERWMTVLVEQDSAAGEALRRLGGSKIEDNVRYTKLGTPARFDKGDEVLVEVCVNRAFQVSSPVNIRLSLVGVATWEVL